MNAKARNFLQAACEVLEQLDQERRAVLPVSAWPRVLQELGLQEDDSAAYFLMDHCQSNGQGFFTFVPLLQALRADQGDGAGGGGGGEGGEQGQGQGASEYGDERGMHSQCGDDRGVPQQQSQNDRSMAPQQACGQDDRGMPPQYGQDDRGAPQFGPDDRGRQPYYQDDRSRPPQYSEDDRGMAPQQTYGHDDRGMPTQYGQDDRGVPQYGPDDRGAPLHYQDDRGRPPQYSQGDRGAPPPYSQEDRSRPQPPSLSSREPAEPLQGSGGPVLPGPNSPSKSIPPSDYGESSLGEDEEVFWARRAPAIQRLYHLWDCNQLSNEAFMLQLQNLLGDRADIANPESEFVRLTNKHRHARNLKFAALMSALRRDAGSVAASRASSVAGWSSQCGGSAQCPPGYAASEAPSDAESLWNTAAGRPTGRREVDSQYRRGRRHYDDGSSSAGGSSAGWSRDGPGPAPGGGYPAGYQRPGSVRGPDGLRTLPQGGAASYGGPIPEDEQFQEPQQYSSGPGEGWPPGQQQGYYQDSGERPQGANAGSPGDDREAQRADAAYWAQTLPQRGGQPASEAGASDLNSLADSQRTGYTLRGRAGHGNILTWGDDSRAVTPERKRRGKQLAAEEPSGSSRSHMSSNIFGPPQGDQRR